MKKRFFGFMAICFMIICFSGAASRVVQASETEDRTAEGEWVKDGDDWRYRVSSGEYLIKDWIFYKGKWYYLDTDGYMAVGTQRIGKQYYYFRENGEMAVGWAYDDDTEQWYYLNDNGTRKTGWYETGGVWYWFDSKGIMYHSGMRMVSGHKYYFFENGQMAANKYVGTYYYGADGLRDRKYDMVIQGKRKPTEEEKNAITKAMENIPGEWIDKCLKSGWEFMYYTDKDYYSAPKTDQGIYYICHKTDTNYKKIKFTKPESLIIAFGEYIAGITGNDKDENLFMADFQHYLMDTSLVQPLPNYFDNKSSMWFGALFECYCDPEIFYDIKEKNSALANFTEQVLGVNTTGRKPTLKELRDNLYKDSAGTINAFGPSTDVLLKKAAGPADETTAASQKNE